MSTAASFEDYYKSTVLDLSNLEGNRKKPKQVTEQINTFSVISMLNNSILDLQRK
jgi:hypothetical protein